MFILDKQFTQYISNLVQKYVKLSSTCHLNFYMVKIQSFFETLSLNLPYKQFFSSFQIGTGKESQYTPAL